MLDRHLKMSDHLAISMSVFSGGCWGLQDPAGIEAGAGMELERAALQRFLERLQWARMYSACAVAHAMQAMESDSAALASRFHALHFLVTQLLKVASSI